LPRPATPTKRRRSPSQSSDKGQYSFSASPSAFPGTYQLTIAANKIKDSDGRINTCKAGESSKLTV
jgi:hypothetical protein